MIKFFRHIRKALLGEGKFSKYLLYATGEIILVVIGILIALSINNWNISRKEARELNDYLLKISENVSEDLMVAESNLDRRKEIVELSRDIINFISLNQYDSLKISNTIEVFVDFQFTTRDGGFQSLTNSSYIGKIKRSMLDSLMFQYYYNVDDLIREEASFNGFMESMEASANAEFSFLTFARGFYGLEVDSVTYANAIKDYFNNVAIQNAIIRSSGQAAVFRKYNALIDTGRLLNEEILEFVESDD